MGILLPFILLRISYKNSLDIFNKIDDNILRLKNENKAERIKHENEILKLNEKNKKLEESLEKEKKYNQDLINIKNKLENSIKLYEQQIKSVNDLNIQKERQIINLEKNINEINNKFKNEKEKKKKI